MIHRNGYYLWNQSTQSSAEVIADLGVGAPATKSVTVHGYTDGGGDFCFITASALHSATRVSGNFANVATGSPSGPFSLSVTLTTAPPAGDTYAYELFCLLGSLNPAQPGGEQVWGFQ